MQTVICLFNKLSDFLFHDECFNGYSDILVFNHIKGFEGKAMRIVIAAHRSNQTAAGNQAALGQVTLADNELTGVCNCTIRICIEIARNTVYFNRLIDIPRNNAVVISLFGQITVIIEGAYLLSFS